MTPQELASAMAAVASAQAARAAALGPRGAPIVPGVVRMRVTFVDVGQGDAAVVQTADGHSALIDSGPPESRERLVTVMAALGISRLDWMMLSHPHTDHIGGAMRVLDRFPVGRIYDPGYAHPIATYDRLLARIGQMSLPYTVARRDLEIPLGNMAHVEVLQPHEPFIERSRSDANSNSVVARVVSGNVRVLFTGDSEWDTERRLLEENRHQLHADVLKVAHHGSRFATTTEFVMAVQPRYAVISSGAGNEYGHPSAAALNNLAQRQVQFFRTDLQGDITMVTDGAAVSMSPSRQAYPQQLSTPAPRERAAGN